MSVSYPCSIGTIGGRSISWVEEGTIRGSRAGATPVGSFLRMQPYTNRLIRVDIVAGVSGVSSGVVEADHIDDRKIRKERQREKALPQSVLDRRTTHIMADTTTKPEETKPTTAESVPAQEKKVEEKVEEKTEAPKTETKAEPKPASSASATDEVPDVNTSDEFKTHEENEIVLLNVYVISWRIHMGAQYVARDCIALQIPFLVTSSLPLVASVHRIQCNVLVSLKCTALNCDRRPL